MTHLLLPLAAGILAKIVPSVVFPCPRKDKDLLGECQSLAKRMVVVSIIANALVWTCWLVFFRSSVAQSLAERLGLALRLEWPNLALYVVLIIRVASARAADVKAVLGQRSNVNDATEIAIRVLNNTTEQLLLGVLLRLAFAASVEGANAFILSAVNGIWLSGRVLFVLGYSENNPMGRELGFDLTMFSSVFVLLALVFHALLGF